MQMPEIDPKNSKRKTIARKINRRWSEAKKLPEGSIARRAKLTSMLDAMRRYEAELGRQLTSEFASLRQKAQAELAAQESAGRSEIDAVQVEPVDSDASQEVPAHV